MITRYGFNKKSQIVEIGSNDGYLLQRFIKKGIPAFGLEPASNIAKFAINRGIPTRIKFFNLKTANELARLGLTADLLIVNNVIAHVPNLIDFVKGMKILLNQSGIITLEFPHLLQLIKQNQFDTIYHEHYSYFSLLFIEKLFSSFNLVIFDVEELPTHGGSLRIYVKHEDDSGHTKSKNVSKLIQKENEFGLDKILTYVNFSKKVEVVKQKLYDFVTNVKRQGKTIVGYGAPAKASILLNYCKIDTNFIDYTVDRNPNKQGLYLPGSQIPIKSPETIRTTRPDYVLILAWNLTNEIMSQMDYIRSWGGKFIIPIPKIQICS